MYYLQSRYYNPELGRFINADVFTSTGQGLLGNNMFAYCLNNPIMNSDPTGRWTWVGAVLGGATSAIGAIMNGGTLSDVLIEFVIGFVSGGCTSVIGSVACILVESAYTILTADSSDPIYLSLLLSVFASQITGDNLNFLLKGTLDSVTINAFDWVFGTGIDLLVSGIDVLLQELYSGNDSVSASNVPTATTTNVPTTPQHSGSTGAGSGFGGYSGGGNSRMFFCK